MNSRRRAPKRRGRGARPRRLLTITALLTAALVAPPPAGAVTLMVNGDTPARRLQRPFNHGRTHVPTPPLRVDLFLTNCPDDDGTGQMIAGCAEIPAEGTPRIWVDPTYQDYAQLVSTIGHELGHIVDRRYLTDADRSEFIRIWRRRPGTEWTTELAPPLPLFGSDGEHGEQSTPEEWFADAYQACLLNRSGFDRLVGLDLIPTKVAARDVAWRFRPTAKRQLLASCALATRALRRR